MAFGTKIPPEESLARLPATRPAPGGESAPQQSGKSEETVEPLKPIDRFEIRDPRYRMADLILPAAVRQDIAVLKSRIQNHALIYVEWGFARVDPLGATVAVNYYGPPGTGKTMCAEALAADLGKRILEVNYAEVESKYVGETAKNIVAAFSQAKQAGALLFFDEADSILGRRMTNVTQAADHGVNVSRAVMLKQLDNFDGIVVFATNLQRNFDEAFKRRILQHVCIPLPDEAGRLELWKRMVGPKTPGRDAVDFSGLAIDSEGFSGGLIKNAVLLALCEVAARDKQSQVLVQADLVRSLGNVRRAEQEVGRGHTTWTELQELPKEL